MNIEKTDKDIIITIPRYQTGKYTYGDGQYTVDNLVGVVAGDECSINQSIYLDYKDDEQTGMPIVHFDGNREDFEIKMTKLGIKIIEYPVCKTCKRVIYGSYSYNKNGECCYLCSKEV